VELVEDAVGLARDRPHDLLTCESERWRLNAVLDRVDAKRAELDALRGRIVAARDARAAGHCVLRVPQAG
jgi:hypothetical protein